MKFFILPKHILMEYSENHKRSALYIPLGSLERRKNSHNKKINFGLYENAWSLFKNPADMALAGTAHVSIADPSLQLARVS